MGSPEENDEAAQEGERRRVILPRPVISDICISLSLTLSRVTAAEEAIYMRMAPL